MTEPDKDAELKAYNLWYGKVRLAAVTAAEQAGMKNYFKNIYADFLCCMSMDELKVVAGEFSRYKLQRFRTIEAVQSDLEAAFNHRDIEALQKELISSQACEDGNVFEMLDKLRELYSRLYDEFKESATLGIDS